MAENREVVLDERSRVRRGVEHVTAMACVTSEILVSGMMMFSAWSNISKCIEKLSVRHQLVFRWVDNLMIDLAIIHSANCDVGKKTSTCLLKRIKPFLPEDKFENLYLLESMHYCGCKQQGNSNKKVY